MKNDHSIHGNCKHPKQINILLSFLTLIVFQNNLNLIFVNMLSKITMSNSNV